MKNANLTQKFWLIKDNVSTYIKAANIYTDMSKKKRIKKLIGQPTLKTYTELKIYRIKKNGFLILNREKH